MLIASPAVSVWVYHEKEKSAIKPELEAVALTPSAEEKPPAIRVPIEILAKGSAPQWIYVEVGSQAIPEPGMLPFFLLTVGLLAFHRQRA